MRSAFCIQTFAFFGLLLALGASPPAPTAADAPVLVFTADTEGHVGPCQSCPVNVGLGGLSRRATAIKELRQRDPSLLLLDAGNALFGPESLDSDGKVILAAYQAMGYDAVNLTPRDFRLGRASTLGVIGNSKVAFVSANLLNDDGTPLVRPYVVKRCGERRIAILGLSQPPAGRDYLPHLKKELAGIVAVEPADALAKWLPRAKVEADLVVLLYYGSVDGARPLADKYASDLSAILIGGSRDEPLPARTKPPWVTTEPHGKELVRIALPDPSHVSAEITRLPVCPTIEKDADLERLLATPPPSPTQH